MQIWQHLSKYHKEQYENIVTDPDWRTKINGLLRPKVLNWKQDIHILESQKGYGRHFCVLDGTKIDKIDSSYVGDKRLVFNTNYASRVLMQNIIDVLILFGIDPDNVKIELKNREMED